VPLRPVTQVRDHPAGVPEQEEEPVVEAAGRQVGLRVHRGGRAEQLQGLVGDVTAEVTQHAAAGGGEAARGRVLLHPRLEGDHLVQRAGFDQRTDGKKVRVPAPVLVDGQGNAGPFGRFDQGAGGGRVRGEGLVADHREAERDRLADQGLVGVQRGRDHDRVGAGHGQVAQAVHGRDAGEVLC
jgi:hypothetical protein